MSAALLRPAPAARWSSARSITCLSRSVKRERVGLIGHNGAGKTTLLRTIAGIYEPTGGTLETTGRLMPLFNLMEGMMPDATGREFIRIRGILLGLEPHHLEALTEEVLEFCELGSYIDMPARTYSTGMLVRLAFALSTSVTSDILLFDELIGAGDARFVSKAQERLKSFVERSNIVIVASHSRAILEQWCNRLLLLEHGKLIADGSVQDVLKEYDRAHRRAKRVRWIPSSPSTACGATWNHRAGSSRPMRQSRSLSMSWALSGPAARRQADDLLSRSLGLFWRGSRARRNR